MLPDDESSAWAKRTRYKALSEEARLTTTRARLQDARVELTYYGVAIHGAVPPSYFGAPSVKVDDEDAAENKAQRLLKRMLLSPKDSWKDGKNALVIAFSDKNRLLQQLFDIFWKLRGVLREQAAAAPAASNSAKNRLELSAPFSRIKRTTRTS